MERVILRKWKGNGQSIIALFPDANTEESRDLIQSYEHIGQHGTASYALMLAHTTPVKFPNTEAEALLKELKTIGYIPILASRR